MTKGPSCAGYCTVALVVTCSTQSGQHVGLGSRGWGEGREHPSSCGLSPRGLCSLVRAGLWLAAHPPASQSFLAHQSHGCALPGCVSEEDKSAGDGTDPGSGGNRRHEGGVGGEGPQRQLWTGSIPCLPRRVDWKRRQGQSSHWKSSGGRRRGGNMAGVGGGGSHCNGNPVSPSAPAAPTAPGSSLTALGRGAAMAADSSSLSCPPTRLGSLWPAAPTLWGGEGGGRRGWGVAIFMLPLPSQI